MTRFSRLIVSVVAAAMLTGPVSAQLLGGSGPLGGVVGGLPGGSPVGGAVRGLGSGSADGGAVSGLQNALGQLGNTTGQILGNPANAVGAVPGALTGVTSRGGFFPASLNQVAVPAELAGMSPGQIADYRLARLSALINANRAVLDRDPQGQPVRRFELICTDPDPASLSLAVRAGFRVVGDERVGDLDIRMVTLTIPKRMNVRQAYKELRRAAPSLQVDYNHVYEPAGGSLAPALGMALAASAGRAPGGPQIAMIDGGVASHPSLAHARVEQQGFAGAPQPTGHGTAVGSLLVGELGPFRGAARGAQLFVGDVYGGNPAAGSSTSVIRALGWAASKRPAVVNVSLVGPDNRALARAIGALRARGIGVTAAVGNDGPAAPPQYPASYPGVIAVTGVDANGRALPEAGKPVHLDFAAPGADMAAALPGQGFTRVRGTSFAAPLAAARLALSGSYQRLAAEARPGKGRVGHGIVCGDCRNDPKMFRAR